MTSAREHSVPPVDRAQRIAEHHDLDILTPAEAAAILRITPRRVKDLARAGRLPVVRIGAHTVRFRRQDVEAFVAAAWEMTR